MIYQILYCHLNSCVDWIFDLFAGIITAVFYTRLFWFRLHHSNTCHSIRDFTFGIRSFTDTHTHPHTHTHSNTHKRLDTWNQTYHNALQLHTFLLTLFSIFQLRQPHSFSQSINRTPFKKPNKKKVNQQSSIN